MSPHWVVTPPGCHLFGMSPPWAVTFLGCHPPGCHHPPGMFLSWFGDNVGTVALCRWQWGCLGTALGWGHFRSPGGTTVGVGTARFSPSVPKPGDKPRSLGGMGTALRQVSPGSAGRGQVRVSCWAWGQPRHRVPSVPSVPMWGRSPVSPASPCGGVVPSVPNVPLWGTSLMSPTSSMSPRSPCGAGPQCPQCPQGPHVGHIPNVPNVSKVPMWGTSLMSPVSPTSPCGAGPHFPNVPNIPMWGGPQCPQNPRVGQIPGVPNAPTQGTSPLSPLSLRGVDLPTPSPPLWGHFGDWVARQVAGGAGAVYSPEPVGGSRAQDPAWHRARCHRHRHRRHRHPWGTAPGRGGGGGDPPPPGMSLVPREMTARRWGLLALGAQRWVALSPVVSLCPQGCPFVPWGVLLSPGGISRPHPAGWSPRGTSLVPCCRWHPSSPGLVPLGGGCPLSQRGCPLFPVPIRDVPCPLTSWGMSHVPCPHKGCPCPLTP